MVIPDDASSIRHAGAGNADVALPCRQRIVWELSGSWSCTHGWRFRARSEWLCSCENHLVRRDIWVDEVCTCDPHSQRGMVTVSHMA